MSGSAPAGAFPASSRTGRESAPSSGRRTAPTVLPSRGNTVFAHAEWSQASASSRTLSGNRDARSSSSVGSVRTSNNCQCGLSMSAGVRASSFPAVLVVATVAGHLGVLLGVSARSGRRTQNGRGRHPVELFHREPVFAHWVRRFRPVSSSVGVRSVTYANWSRIPLSSAPGFNPAGQDRRKGTRIPPAKDCPL